MAYQFTFGQVIAAGIDRAMQDRRQRLQTEAQERADAKRVTLEKERIGIERQRTDDARKAQQQQHEIDSKNAYNEGLRTKAQVEASGAETRLNTLKTDVVEDEIKDLDAKVAIPQKIRDATGLPESMTGREIRRLKDLGFDNLLYAITQGEYSNRTAAINASDNGSTRRGAVDALAGYGMMTDADLQDEYDRLERQSRYEVGVGVPYTDESGQPGVSEKIWETIDQERTREARSAVGAVMAARGLKPTGGGSGIVAPTITPRQSAIRYGLRDKSTQDLLKIGGMTADDDSLAAVRMLLNGGKPGR
jgi:hypothetical protein